MAAARHDSETTRVATRVRGYSRIVRCVRKVDWTRADGDRLATARRQNGHSQTECAEALRRLGATVGTQASVSNWETARTGPSDSATLTAIDMYCADVDGADPPLPETTTADPASSFPKLVENLLGSPPLSDRQARFIDSLIDRLASGSPLSPEDGVAIRLVSRALGLNTRV
jgi:transcriptional regulator with XRE-family HTH domain